MKQIVNTHTEYTQTEIREFKAEWSEIVKDNDIGDEDYNFEERAFESAMTEKE